MLRADTTQSARMVDLDAFDTVIINGTSDWVMPKETAAAKLHKWRKECNASYDNLASNVGK